MCFSFPGMITYLFILRAMLLCEKATTSEKAYSNIKVWQK